MRSNVYVTDLPLTPSTENEQGGPQQPPTLEEIDVFRHREITSKAVSAILLLTLKWFKASRTWWNIYHLSSVLC